MLQRDSRLVPRTHSLRPLCQSALGLKWSVREICSTNQLALLDRSSRRPGYQGGQPSARQETGPGRRGLARQARSQTARQPCAFQPFRLCRLRISPLPRYFSSSPSNFGSLPYRQPAPRERTGAPSLGPASSVCPARSFPPLPPTLVGRAHASMLVSHQAPSPSCVPIRHGCACASPFVPHIL